MGLELILKDISDPVLRENFYRIQRYVADNVLLGTDFKFFEVTIPQASDSFPIPHGLTFIPTDIIPLKAEGDFNYYFRSDTTDRLNIYVATKGPVKLRFLAGRYEQVSRPSLRNQTLSFVAPATGQTTTPGQGSGGAASGVTYPFSQKSLLWVINHNLGYYPSTEVFDSGGAEIDAEVQSTSINQVQVRFVTPTSGSARLT